MMRFVVRALVPARPRRAFRSRLDARYVTKADHRQDVRNIREEFRRLHREAKADPRRATVDKAAEGAAGATAEDAIRSALREIQLLRQEVVALRGEVDRLRQLKLAVSKANDEAVRGHRLAVRTADALDYVLQNEVRTQQAIDGLTAQMPATEPVR
jgi:hypothetical protein